MKCRWLLPILSFPSVSMNASTLICEALNQPPSPFPPETRLDSMPGFDSLALVGIVVRVESQIDRELTEAEMERLLTVQDVADLLGG